MARGGRQHVPRPDVVGTGPPAAWAGRPDVAAALTRASLEAAVAVQRPDQVITVPNMRDAAVLVPFLDGPSGLELILVKRGSTAPAHAGEIAFPGGICDVDDPDPTGTALREAEEEVGLARSDVDVIGPLERVSTVATAFTVTPVVGWVGQVRDWVPQPGEIEAVLRVPVVDLVDPGAYHAETWVRPEWEVHFFDIEGETIWGLTARILEGLLRRVFAS